MLSDRGLIRRGQGAPAPAAALPYPAERIETTREWLRRDLLREPTEAELATWCRWLSTSGAWAADEA